MIASWDGRSYSDRYTEYTIEGLNLYGEDLLSDSKEIEDDGFCSNYNQLNKDQRIQFWVMMISSISKHESGFNTGAKYKEKSGEYSRGLLQLGFSSTKQQAYSCGFENQFEINSNPKKNLHCGVKILNHWIKHDDVIRADRGDFAPVGLVLQDTGLLLGLLFGSNKKECDLRRLKQTHKIFRFVVRSALL